MAKKTTRTGGAKSTRRRKPKPTPDVDGYINTEDVVKALEYYKALKAFSPPDSPNYYWAETLDAYKAG